MINSTQINSMWYIYIVAQLVKNPPAMRETGFDPWVGKIPWRGKVYTLQAWRIPWTV